MHRIATLSLATLLALTAPAGSALARQQQPAGSEAPAAAQPRPQVQQFVLRAANPIEVADILRANYNVVATGSTSTSTVTVTITPGTSVSTLTEQIVKLDDLALARLTETRKRQQFESDQARERERIELAELQERLQSKSISIDFAGGTVSEYLDMVAKASSVGNIIIGDDRIKSLKMPAVRVKKVTGTAAIILLESLRFSSNGRSAGVSVQLIPGDPDQIGIDAESMLVVDIHVNEAEALGDVASTQVFDLQGFKQNESAVEDMKKVIDAVRTAVELQGPSEHFKISLHEGTGLLFVRGSSEDLRIASQTVGTITGVNGN